MSQLSDQLQFIVFYLQVGVRGGSNTVLRRQRSENPQGRSGDQMKNKFFFERIHLF
jgi:hypothetical protein